MFDFHEKRKIRRILYSKVSIGVVLILTVLLMSAVWERYTVSKEMKERLDDKYAELEIIQQRAETIESKVEYLKNERGVEEELRNRFDVAREGEQVVILLDDEEREDKNKTSDETEVLVKERSFLDTLFFWR